MILEKLQIALKTKFETEQREGIHISDLVLCGRRAAYKRLNPEPLTMKELNYFTSGRAIGDCIAILAQQYSSRFEAEKEIKYKNIVGHIDLYDSENNIPIEIKSARMKEMSEPKQHYIEQIKSYMAIVGAGKGIILVQLLLNFDDKPFVEFEINMTEDEREQQLAKLEAKSEKFLQALSRKNHMVAHDVFTDKNLNWLCRDCRLKKRCEDDHI